MPNPRLPEGCAPSDDESDMESSGAENHEINEETSPNAPPRETTTDAVSEGLPGGAATEDGHEKNHHHHDGHNHSQNGIEDQHAEHSNHSGAENLYPEIAAVLGIEHQENTKDGKIKRSVMLDAVTLRDSTHLPGSTHRSTGNGAILPGGLQDGDDEEEEDSITPFPPPPDRGSALSSSICHVSSVRAVPLDQEQSTIPDQISAFREPPMAQAVPVPMEDQPDGCTTSVLYHRPHPLSNNMITQLSAFGYSGGLISTLDELKARRPIRFWLVDNSGSMLSPGGCEIRGASGQKIYAAECTRWVELKGAVAWHAALAGVLETHTVFRLLNAPENMPNFQEFAVADPSADMLVAESVKRANDIMCSVAPRGFTPLTVHLEGVRESVQAIRKTLENRSQQAVVVIATDGLPTDDAGDSTAEAREAFEKALKSLQPLPVWLVIRLCTDDPDVMEYYNGLDRKVRGCVA